MQPSFQQAIEAHRSVRKAIYYSPEPPVWTIHRKPRLLPVHSDTLVSMDRVRSQIALQTNESGLTNIGVIVSALLGDGIASGFAEERVSDHDSLCRVLEAGHIPHGIPASEKPVPMGEVRQVAREHGLSLPEVPAKIGDDIIAEENTLAAAIELALRRFAPDALFLASRFVVSDPLFADKKIAHVLDIFWLVRDTQHRDRVRQLALQIGGLVNDRRDKDLANRGIEVFHVVSDWARIDPQRCIFEVFDLAGLPTLSQFRKSVPGRTISEYRCGFCRDGMIRTATGEGIAYVRDRAVHEQCVNRAAAEGFADDIA